MPSKSPQDKIEELTSALSTLRERVSTIQEQIRTLVAESADRGQAVENVKQATLLLKHQVDELTPLRDQLRELEHVRTKLALLEQTTEDLKKTKDEWSRRFWAMAGPIIGALAGAAFGYFLRR